MNIGRATEYRNTSQLFIGVNLLKIVGVGLGPQKIFLMSFEMLNFYAFWTLEQGDSTATVIKIFLTSAHQAVGAWGPLNAEGPLCTAQPAQPIATPLNQMPPLMPPLFAVRITVRIYFSEPPHNREEDKCFSVFFTCINQRDIKRE